MMRKHNIVLTAGICLLFCFPSYSQFFCKNFFSLSGKKDIAFKCVAQDKNGALWIGTNEGLIKFDGSKTELFKTENGLSDQKVTSVFCADNDKVWIGTESGKIFSLHNNHIDSLPFGKTPPANKITSIYVTPAGKLFASTYGDGVFIADKTSIEKLNNEKGLSDNVVYNISFHNNQLWCGTDAGISILSDLDGKTTCSILSNKQGLPDNIVRNISGAGDKLVISMQDSGVCQYDLKNKKFERFPFFTNWQQGAVVNTIAYGKNNFAVATEKNGLIIIDNGLLYIENYLPLIQVNAVNFLLKDNSGNLWLTSAKGLHQFYEKRFDFINAQRGLTSEKVSAITIDDDNDIWIGTEAGVLEIRKDANGKLVVNSESRISHLTISCAAKSKNGDIWFGTYSNGIIILDPTTHKITNINSKTGSLPNDNISTIYFDDNTAYISTLGGGLIVADASSASAMKINKVYTEADGLGSNYVYAAITGNKGELFVASDGAGIELLENGKFISLTTKFKFNSNTVYSLCKDKSGNIWSVSNANGILKYDGNSLISIGQKEGLRDEQPQQLIAADNTVYAIHAKGIDKINCSDNSVSYYDVLDGDLEPNLNAICSDKGILYSGTNNGVLSYRYESKVNDTIKPSALIGQLQINYKNFPIDSITEFKHNQNNISFGFTGIWLKNPEKLIFRYKLRGFENDWNYSNEGKLVNYNNLNAGDYSFVVQSKNEEDIWSNETTFSFTVLAPYWKKWWFWALVLIVLGTGIYLLVRYRLKALQKENLILEEKVSERTKEIEKQSKIIEDKSKELELLSLVASKTDNVVLILDAEGRMEYVNESFVKLNRITLEELKKQGETIFEISNNPEIRNIVQNAISNRHSVKYEAINKIDENNEVYEASTLTPIFNEQGELKKIIIIDSDVTESKRQERIIVQKNKDITDSIEYARKIQTAILPADKLIKKYLPQSFVLYKTKDIVSGDFYWFTEKEGCSIIAAVDCTGHGVPGAFMSLIGYNILNRIVGEQHITDPGTILKELNKGVLDALYKNISAHEAKDGMDIVICKIPNNGTKFEYAGAMRPLWIAKGNQITEVKANKVPIGTSPEPGKEIDYTTHSFELAKDETVYIFTDGYADQFGGEKGKKMTTTRFKEHLIKYHSLPMHEQHDALMKEHLQWKSNNEQVDDILVIGFRL